MTNAAVYDASPAAFICHVPNRRDFSAILNRYLELEPDILLGGGKEQFLPKSQPGSRRNDEIDLIAAFVKKAISMSLTRRSSSKRSAAKFWDFSVPPT